MSSELAPAKLGLDESKGQVLMLIVMLIEAGLEWHG